jgi:hypothetical protein
VLAAAAALRTQTQLRALVALVGAVPVEMALQPMVRKVQKTRGQVVVAGAVIRHRQQGVQAAPVL